MSGYKKNSLYRRREENNFCLPACLPWTMRLCFPIIFHLPQSDFFTFYLTFLCCFSIDHFGGGKENFATIWECFRGGTPIIVSVWRWGFGKIKILNVSQIFFVFFTHSRFFLLSLVSIVVHV